MNELAPRSDLGANVVAPSGQDAVGGASESAPAPAPSPVLPSSLILLIVVASVVTGVLLLRLVLFLIDPAAAVGHLPGVDESLPALNRMAGGGAGGGTGAPW